MPIAGVVILTREEMTSQVLNQLQNVENVTTYGVHKNNNIVAVFEGQTPKELERINDKLINEVPGILGIYPAYVNYEDVEEQND
ncbi:MAG TPA: hypothetical protein ENK44_12520 [Caldithrix abyssi]|uniref:Chaperone NapD n=1 Tax=Caldithrix abyssi TaxID=187145 RepID=A0A7V4WVS9_CALAY|nr:hypothetical protein [Caldithrix abyssi]